MLTLLAGDGISERLVTPPSSVVSGIGGALVVEDVNMEGEVVIDGDAVVGGDVVTGSVICVTLGLITTAVLNNHDASSYANQHTVFKWPRSSAHLQCNDILLISSIFLKFTS